MPPGDQHRHKTRQLSPEAREYKKDWVLGRDVGAPITTRLSIWNPSKHHTTVARPLMGPQQSRSRKGCDLLDQGGRREWKFQPSPGLPGATFLGIPDRVAAASGSAGLTSQRLLLITG